MIEFARTSPSGWTPIENPRLEPVRLALPQRLALHWARARTGEPRPVANFPDRANRRRQTVPNPSGRYCACGRRDYDDEVCDACQAESFWHLMHPWPHTRAERRYRHRQIFEARIAAEVQHAETRDRGFVNAR